jgi:hypothetical protein
MDLQGHMIEKHQGKMTNRDKKETRRVVDGIEFEHLSRSYVRNNRSGDNRNSNQPTPRNSRREAFGAQLTTPASFPALPSSRFERERGPTATSEAQPMTLFELDNPDQSILE